MSENKAPSQNFYLDNLKKVRFEPSKQHSSSLLKTFSAKFPKSIIDHALEARLQNMLLSYSTKGFRKGKVPMSILKSNESQRIFSEELGNFCNKVVLELINQNNFKTTSPAKISFEKIEQGSDLELKIELELFPKIPEIDFSKLEIKDYELVPTEEEIQNKIKRLASPFIERHEVSDSNYLAVIGDVLKIDYLGKIDGVAFEGGNSLDAFLELGSASFIDNFEEQLIGKKIGDEVLVKVKFPEKYHQQSLAGKNAEFDVKIKGIESAKADLLSSVDDIFVKENFGLESLSDLKKLITERESSIAEFLFFRLRKKQIVEYIENFLDFDLPPSMLEKLTTQNNFREMKFESEEKSQLDSMARKSLGVFLVIEDLGRRFDVKVLPQDLKDEAQKLYSAFGRDASGIIRNFEKNSSAREEKYRDIFEYKIFKEIVSLAKVHKDQLSILQANNLAIGLI